MREAIRQVSEFHQSESMARTTGAKPLSFARTAPSQGISNQGLQRLLRNKMIQAKLKISSPGDKHEQEADRVADEVMRMPGAQPNAKRGTTVGDLGIQRMCGECEDELHRQPIEEDEELQTKEIPGQSPHATTEVREQVAAMSGGGNPLAGSVRQFFEPRFGHDFSNVRVHTDSRASAAARDINARAFTRGTDVFFGRGEYSPDTSRGRHLLAHELAHTIQQSTKQNSHLARTSEPVVQRQTIHSSCPATQHPAIQGAWGTAIDLLQNTLRILNGLVDFVTEPGGPAARLPSVTETLRKVFGEIGGMDGNTTVHTFGPLIRNFERILAGFNSHTVRCAAVGDLRCRGELRAGFYDSSVRNTLFLCPEFQNRDRTEVAETLIHEMAHSVLRATHEGLGPDDNEDIAVGMLFDCNASGLGLSYEVARRNAYAYEILVACWVGSQPTSVSTAPRVPTVASPANTLGAVALYSPPGSFGAEARYSRVLLGRSSRLQFLAGANISYLSQGDEIGLGAGVSLRYSWPRIYIRGGGQLSGEASVSPPTGSPRPALRLDVAPDFEAGVRIGIVRIGAGYQLLIPVAANTSTAELRHRISLGISFDL